MFTRSRTVSRREERQGKGVRELIRACRGLVNSLLTGRSPLSPHDPNLGNSLLDHRRSSPYHHDLDLGDSICDYQRNEPSFVRGS